MKKKSKLFAILLSLCISCFGIQTRTVFANDNVPNDDVPAYISDPNSNYIANPDNIIDENLLPPLPSPYAVRPNIGDGGAYPAGTYNWVYSNSGNISSYNCYAFVLNKQGSGFISPGRFSVAINTQTANISTFNNAILNDLKQLNYNARIVSSNYVPAAGEICYRRAMNSDGTYSDFHFMKKEGNYWIHKPGGTAILIYKGDPGSGAWVAEYYQNGWKIDRGITYNSMIQYIVYSKK